MYALLSHLKLSWKHNKKKTIFPNQRPRISLFIGLFSRNQLKVSGLIFIVEKKKHDQVDGKKSHEGEEADTDSAKKITNRDQFR